MTVWAGEHPDLADLVERSDEPAVAEHLQSCATCRARARVLTSDLGEPPGLNEARAAMARTRTQITRQLSLSLGIPDEPDEDDDLEAGRRIERYRVEERVGSGGMGTVYRVVHEQLGSQHALKVLHRTSRKVKERLVREGRAQSRLAHPNIVSVTDIVDVDGAPGLVMELVRGPTLARLLAREGRPSPADADRIACDILRGVAAAHQAGIVHRDLKPANVLLLPTGDGWVAKVSDFGLARVMAGEDDPGLTGSRAPMGTPAYMAPEQVRDASRADARSDVFALGALLYELLSGEQAFAAPDVITTYDRIRAGDVRPLSEVAPDVPQGWVRVVERALQVDPLLRFADGAALYEAWREADAVGPASAPPPSRTGWLYGVAGLAAAALVGVSGLVIWQGIGGSSERASTPAADGGFVERRLTNRPPDTQLYALNGSPDGTRFAWTDGRGVWLQSVDGGAPELVLEGTALHNVVFYPDGERLWVSGWDRGEAGIWTVPLDGGEVGYVPEEIGTLARLSPDGEQIAYASPTGLWVAAPDGEGRRRLRSVSANEGVLALAWSPDARHLAIVSFRRGESVGSIEIVAVDGTSIRRPVQDADLVQHHIAALAWTEPDSLFYATKEFSKDDDESPVSRLYALRAASVAGGDAAPELLHTWEGFLVLRLEPADGGRRMFASRAESRPSVLVFDLDDPSGAAPPTPESWRERPVGWDGPDALAVVSDRAGGGLYRYDLVTGDIHRLMDDDQPIALRMPDGLVLAYDKEAERMVGLRPDADGVPREVFGVDPPEGTPDDVAYGMRCSWGRCTISLTDDSSIRFLRVDLETGALGEPFLTVPIGTRMLAWDISPDGHELALSVSNPPSLTIYDLEAGTSASRPTLIEYPQSVAWDADGERVYQAGLTEAGDTPYAMTVVGREGRPETLWTSLARIPYGLQVSPDGRRMSMGVRGLDDDIWLIDGLR